MKNKLIGKEKHEPSCGICEYGRASDFDSQILCTKNGVMEENDSCRHFKYDPLKRKPVKIKLNKDFSPEDFEL